MLLRSGLAYDATPPSTTVEPYEPGSVALPADLAMSRPAAELLDEKSRFTVEGWQENILHESTERNWRRDACDVTPYWDAKLKKNNREYRKFIARLDKLGLIRWTTEPLEHASLFFVAKKDKTLRMIVDARRANAVCREPPKVSWVTAEGLSRFETSSDTVASGHCCFAVGDVNNCFHRLRLPEGMHRLFALRPLDAKHTTLALPPGTAVYPCIASFPMGFAWSLWVAQSVGEAVLGRVPELRDVPRLSDRGLPLMLGPSTSAAYLLYVDNFAVVGSDMRQVRALRDAGVRALNEVGLEVHEVEDHEDGGELLGCWLDTQKCETTVTEKRKWRVDGALRWLLRHRRVSGKQLEKILGHATFISMIDRTGLTVFSATYAFIRKHNDRAAVWWPSVRLELQSFLGLLPLLRSPWALDWSEIITATDASLSGWGGLPRRSARDACRRLGTHPGSLTFQASGRRWGERGGGPLLRGRRLSDGRLPWRLAGRVAGHRVGG